MCGATGILMKNVRCNRIPNEKCAGQLDAARTHPAPAHKNIPSDHPPSEPTRRRRTKAFHLTTDRPDPRILEKIFHFAAICWLARWLVGFAVDRLNRGPLAGAKKKNKQRHAHPRDLTESVRKRHDKTKKRPSTQRRWYYLADSGFVRGCVPF